ncbi:MAG: hypothetical protein EXS10_09480 [Phycisphaerales bacterium]|nr:hypothetical protein [Phycisphaerales bacterium]
MMPLAPIIEERLPAIRALCEQLGVSQSWIFGSAARGDMFPCRIRLISMRALSRRCMFERSVGVLADSKTYIGAQRTR